jgi:hypothetical protein
MRVLLVLLLTGAAVLSHQIGYRLAEIHAHKGVSWVDITGINCRAARHTTQHRWSAVYKL